MQYDENFIQKYPKKVFNKLAIPLLIFEVFNTFFSMLDMFWAAILGVNIIMIVGLCNPLVILITKFGTTLGQGTNSYMSRCLGIKDLNNAKNTLNHGIMIGLIISIIIPILFILFIDSIFNFLNLKSMLELTKWYIIPLILCSFIFIFTNFFSETLQSEGDSKTPVSSMIIGNIIKLILAPIFIFYFKLGIFGLALSTIIGLLIPLIIFIYIYFFKKKINIKFNLNLTIFKEIFKVAFPNFIDRSIFTYLTFFINYMFIFIGDPTAIAFYTIYDRVSDFIQSTARGTSKGLLTVTGHLYGSNKIKDIKSLYKHGLLITSFMSLITSILFIMFHPQIFNLLGISENSFKHVHIIIIGIIIINMVIPVSFCSSKLLDGIGKSIYALFGSIFYIIISTIFIILNVIIFNLNEIFILISLIIGEIIVIFYYLILIHFVFKKEINKNSN